MKRKENEAEESDVEIDFEGPTRVLVCGGRDWTDEGTIAAFIDCLPPGSTVVHGAARGADSIAAKIASEMGFDVEAFPADWSSFGRSAGAIRNRQMLSDGKPDIVVAFHDDIESSKGTKDMLDVAARAGLTCVLFTGEDAFGG